MAKHALPNHLWLVLVILFAQIILNVFGATVLLYAGLLHFVVWFSLLASVVLAVSTLFLMLRNPWARYPVIAVEALTMVNGAVALVTSGALTGVTNIALGFAVISMLYRPDVLQWLADVATSGHHSARLPSSWRHTGGRQA